MSLTSMMLIFHSFIILTVFKLCSCQSQAGQKQSGNYDIKITYIEPCEQRNETIQMGFFNTRMSKSNRTHTCISGLYSLPYGLSDDMQESWELFSKGSTGGWKRMMTFKNKKACTDKKRLFPSWFNLLKLKNVPCPIPPGNFTIDCYNLTGWKFSMAKTLTYGEYKAKVNFYHKGENIGCTDFRADIVPMADEAK